MTRGLVTDETLRYGMYISIFFHLYLLYIFQVIVTMSIISSVRSEPSDYVDWAVGIGWAMDAAPIGAIVIVAIVQLIRYRVSIYQILLIKIEN